MNRDNQSVTDGVYGSTIRDGLFARRRFWRRLRGPVNDWWPFGWLLLAGLFLLFFIGTFVVSPGIQQHAKDSVVDALTAAGYQVTAAGASGQRVRVLVTGAMDSEYADTRIASIARGAQCPSWIGSLICPTRVEVTLDPAAAPDRTPTPAPADYRFHDLRIERDGERLRLFGEVPDDDSRLWLLARVRSAFPQTEESLTVTGDPASPAYRVAVNRAVSVLQPLERGTVRWERGAFSLDGLVTAEQEPAAIATYAEAEAELNAAAPALQLAKSQDSCDAEFAAVLAESTINFESASARINADSTAVLDGLAELAEQCPGDLVVEGHTDSSGADERNQQLSDRRANAVRDALITRGIRRARVRAIGLGETQPIADNETTAGRALNRRIVVRLDR